MAFTEPQFRLGTSSLEDYTLDTVDPDGGIIEASFAEGFNEISISSNQAHTGSKSMYMLSTGGFANCSAELTRVGWIDVSDQVEFKVDVWWYHVAGDAPFAFVLWRADGVVEDVVELGRLSAVEGEWAYSEWVVPVGDYPQVSVLIAFDWFFPAIQGEGYVDDWQVWFDGSEPEPQPLSDIVYRGFRLPYKRTELERNMLFVERQLEQYLHEHGNSDARRVGFRFPRRDFNNESAKMENARYLQTQLELYLHDHVGEEQQEVPNE